MADDNDFTSCKKQFERSDEKMEALTSLVFSDMTTLTPQVLLEWFIFVMVVEFMGIMINWTKAGN